MSALSEAILKLFGEKETVMSDIDTAILTLRDRALYPKVVHNRDARVTAAFAVREEQVESVDGEQTNLEIHVGVFACCPKDVWIRSRGYQGAIKRLVRHPHVFFVRNIREGDREEIINDIFRFFTSLEADRQVNKLQADLAAYVGNGREVG